MVKLPRLSRVAMILVLLALVAAGALGGFLFETGALSVNTTTQRFTWANVEGAGATGNTLPGELLDQDTYVASWDPSLIGQRASVSGALKIDPSSCGFDCSGGVRVTGQRTDYVLELPGGDVLSYQKFLTQPFGARVNPNQWFGPTTSIFWDIKPDDGKTVIPSGSVLTANYYVSVVWTKCLIICVDSDKGEGLVAQDKAVIYSGIGSVHWEGTHGSGTGIYYITGETAKACWNVGYVKDQIANRGWAIHIFSGAQNAVVLPLTQISQLTGCVSYRVSDKDFAPGNAVITAYLRNELWGKDFAGASAIRAADVARMPTCSVDGFEPQSPKQGDTVTASFRCTPATSSVNDSLAKIVVTYGYGSPSNSVDLAGNATSYSLVAENSGILNFELVGYSVAGIPSGTSNYKISVEHQPADDCLGSVDYCNPNDQLPLGVPLWIYFLLAGIVALMVAIFIPRGLVVPLVRIVIALVGVILFILAFVFYG